MRMNNKERQQKLDIEKWLASEKVGYDKAGGMEWCTYCEWTEYVDNKNGGMCTYEPTSKSKYPCATAYNRMKKQIK